MLLKKIHLIIALVILAISILSSPIHQDKNEVALYQLDIENEENYSSSDEEDEIVAPTDIASIGVDDDDDTTVGVEEPITQDIKIIKPTNNIQQINENLSYYEYHGKFNVEYTQPSNEIQFACSSFSVEKKDSSGYYFGRNFDFHSTNGTIVVTYPEDGKSYASISTVANRFIDEVFPNIPEDILKLISVYVPLDGMNEKGLTVSINMAYGRNAADQNTPNPEITLTTAARLLLDRAATVDEAFELLKGYDMRKGDLQLESHIAITDASGKAIVVEYIDNEIKRIEDPINENFYLFDNLREPSPNRTLGHRYDIIKERLEKIPKMTIEDVKETLNLTNQCYIKEDLYTEWSVIYDKAKKEATYYHRCDFDHGFKVVLDYE